ncbi:hypothetical protein M0R45_015331 [Rubus argutus]|uniref:DRBM domain-containing protein n=1 Tax=Rubus argutus TaxID=59490 RepID=A0AAW1XPD2_RUBAR
MLMANLLPRVLLIEQNEVAKIEQDEGSSHEKKFVLTVQIATINGVLCMTGDEKSRVKDAENSAPSLMIRTLQESDYV